jgi:hypothetical protein
MARNVSEISIPSLLHAATIRLAAEGALNEVSWLRRRLFEIDERRVTIKSEMLDARASELHALADEEEDLLNRLAELEDQYADGEES